MAEWMDVIHAIRRICVERHGQCAPCVLSEYACPNNARFDQTNEVEFRKIEDFVVKWMTANPEPIYPSWGEFLCSIGLIHDCTDSDEVVGRLFDNEIPADIAEKLGIAPKEG